MKAALVWSLLLLAGLVSCTPVQDKTIDLPDWVQIPEWVRDLIETIKNILANPPADIPDWLPDISEIAKPEWWPDHGAIGKPEWWPDFEAIEWPDLGAIQWPDKPEWWPDLEAIEWPEININEAVPGTPATVEQFPSIVQIEVGSGSLWAQGCAGSVITTLHILTSAICCSGRLYDDRFRRVRAGSSTRYNDGSVIGVDRVTVHPDFNGEIFMAYDIAVVRLASSLSFGSTIQQTPIVAPGFNVPSGLPLTHAGWGTTAQGSKIANRDLHSIGLVSVGHAECNERWQSLIPIGPITVTANQICAARPETGGRNSDLRDMGAPLFYDNILMGIVSMGHTLGNQKFPLIATAVSPHTNWIVDNAV